VECNLSDIYLNMTEFVTLGKGKFVQYCKDNIFNNKKTSQSRPRNLGNHFLSSLAGRGV